MSFEKATRQRLRFRTVKGNLTTEDLWDLTIEDLDLLAVDLDDKAKSSATRSFVKAPTAANAENQLKFDVVKHILDVKLAEKEKAQKAKEKRLEGERLKEQLAKIQDKKLEGLTEEEITAKLLALEEA
jgi:hypothetical protein